jgi:L-ascorbate metabolism protein UlaG (beta-lactamase superfamily)
MRKYLVIIFFLLLGANKINAAADSLHNIGHASMKIKTADGKVIYIDPFQPPASVYSEPADIILVTHAHGDHSQINMVTQKPNCTVITYTQANIGGTYQSFNVDGIKIYSVAAYSQNHDKNQCVGYVLEFNGIKLYHAGDTGNIPEMVELADSNITYALLPVDGVFTMSPEEATDAANNIQADYSIPMHTEPPPDNYSEDIVARFTPANRLLVRNGKTIALGNQSTDVDNETEIPSGFKLYHSYPNPFNPVTNFEFRISNRDLVTLKIYDMLGKEIAVIVNKILSPGIYKYTWDASGFTSGVYFYTVKAGRFSDTKKFVLLK